MTIFRIEMIGEARVSYQVEAVDAAEGVVKALGSDFSNAAVFVEKINPTSVRIIEEEGD